MNYKTLTLTLLLGLASLQAQAEMTMSHEGHDMSQMEGMDMQMIGDQVMTKGIITRLDEANSKIGIKHEAINNLKMPPMTMVFVAADPAQLKGLKVGDAIHFHAESLSGKLTVTAIKPQ